MSAISRRALIQRALAGAAVVAVGASLPLALEAAPIAGTKTLPNDATEDFAQNVWHRRRPWRRHRRRVCWWHRGHRHCRWRWY